MSDKTYKSLQIDDLEAFLFWWRCQIIQLLPFLKWVIRWVITLKMLTHWTWG